MLQVLKSQLGDSMTSVRRFLQKPIQLGDGGLTLGTSKAAQKAAAREENRKRVRHMKRDLFTLLGQHPSSRKLLRHLAAVERALRTDGLTGLDALPARVIAKALEEMEKLVWDWSPTGLAELRSRMAVRIKNCSPAELAPLPADAVDADHAMRATIAADISEVDHAEFEEMERSWTGFVPAARSAQAVAA